MTHLRLALAATLLLILGAGVASARTVSIGSHGATIELDDGWTRTKLVPDLGPDQFLEDSALGLVFLEVETLMATRQDFERTVSMFQSGRFLGAVAVGEGTFSRRDDGIGVYTAWFDMATNGVRLRYGVHVIGEGSLAYLVMCWTPAFRADDLEASTTEVVSSFQLPPPPSVQPVTARIGGVEVSSTYPARLLAPAPEDELGAAEVGLVSPDDELLCYLLESEGPAEEILEFVEQDQRDELPEGSEVKTLVRFQRELNGVGGLFHVFRVTMEDSEQVIVSGAWPLGDQFLDLRIFMVGTWDAERSALVDDLLDRLSFDATAQRSLDAFPQLAESPSDDEEPLAPEVREFLSRVEALPLEMEAVGNTFVDATSSLTIVDKGALVRVSLPDGQTTPLPGASGGWGTSAYGLADGRTLIVDNEPARLLKDEITVTLDVTPTAAVPLVDGGVILGLPPEPSSEPAFPGESSARSAHLDVRSDPSKTGRLLPVGLASVEHLGLSTSGETALAVGPGMGESQWSEGLSLVEVDLASGETSLRAERWSFISAVAHGPEGWIVSGTLLSTGESGAMSLGSDPPRVLIAGQGVEVLAARGDHLLVRGFWDDKGWLYRVPHEVAAELGTSLVPFDAGTLAAVAAAATRAAGLHSPAEALDSRESLDRFLSAADGAAEDLFGRSLPTEPAAFDRMVEDVTYVVGPDVHFLVTALYVRVMLGEGAEWSTSSLRGPSTKTGWLVPNAFVIGVDPWGVITSTLFDGEGLWHPASEALEVAAGRRILLGRAGEDLWDAVTRADSPGWAQEIGEASRAETAALLDAAPENRHLRGRVWSLLAGARRFSDLVALAEPWASQDEPEATDVAAWLAARAAAGVKGPRARARLVDDVRDALETHPYQPQLLMVLGTLHLEGRAEERAELARLCFEKVIEEAGAWSALGKSAQAALDSLDAAAAR